MPLLGKPQQERWGKEDEGTKDSVCHIFLLNNSIKTWDISILITSLLDYMLLVSTLTPLFLFLFLVTPNLEILSQILVCI